MTSLTSSELRTNATDFEATWRPYIDAITDATAPNQISNGGPVIAVQIGMPPYFTPGGCVRLNSAAFHKITNILKLRSSVQNTLLSLKLLTLRTALSCLCQYCDIFASPSVLISFTIGRTTTPGKAETSSTVQVLSISMDWQVYSSKVQSKPTHRFAGLVPSRI